MDILKDSKLLALMKIMVMMTMKLVVVVISKEQKQLFRFPKHFCTLQLKLQDEGSCFCAGGKEIRVMQTPKTKQALPLVYMQCNIVHWPKGMQLGGWYCMPALILLRKAGRTCRPHWKNGTKCHVTVLNVT